MEGKGTGKDGKGDGEICSEEEERKGGKWKGKWHVIGKGKVKEGQG